MLKIAKRTEHGQVMIFLIFVVVGMLAFASLALDGGKVFADRRQAQNAADTAALAGALAKVNGFPNWQAFAISRAASNGFDNNDPEATVEVYSPPISGPYQGNQEYVQVIITATADTALIHLVYPGPVRFTVEAVARAQPGQLGSLFFGNALVGLAPHGCAVFWAHGDQEATIEGSGIWVNSDDPNCAFRQNGNGVLHAEEGGCVVGGASYTPSKVDGTVTEGCPQVPFPPTVNIPEPVCSSPAVKSGNTLSPGYWNGAFPPSGVTHLAPGVYCVNGDFRVNGGDELIGHDVMIFMESGEIRWNGNATIHLDAPDSGEYAGLLIYKPMSNTASVVIDGNEDTTIEGTIYAPNSPVFISGTGAINGFKSQIVGYTIELSGTSDTYIKFDEDKNYKANIPPKLDLSQ